MSSLLLINIPRESRLRAPLKSWESPWNRFVNHTQVRYESATGQQQDLGKFAVSARYALSKNTFLYAGGSISTGDLKNYISQKTALQAGLRTAF